MDNDFAYYQMIDSFNCDGRYSNSVLSSCIGFPYDEYTNTNTIFLNNVEYGIEYFNNG